MNESDAKASVESPQRPRPGLASLLDAGAATSAASKGAPVSSRAGAGLKWRSMALVGVRMMFHDRLKMMGTMFGVVFAVLLSNQQAGTFLGLLQKNTMFVDHAGADIWILPALTQTLQPGKALPAAALMAARVTPGVAWAEPMLYGGASVSLPGGGSEQVTLVGTRYPLFKGGPWNVIAGDSQALLHADTMIFEDSEREKLGGLNLGSRREVSGHNIQVGGFTVGLLPFGPSYAFAEYDLARELLHTDSDQEHFVLVGVTPGQDPLAIRAALQARLPDTRVLASAEFAKSIVHYLLVVTPLGITFGTSTIFGIIIGFIIVTLSMLSAVVDNIREFGTLKAIGAKNADLAMILFVQAVIYAVTGTAIGIAVITQVAAAIHSPKFSMILPSWLLLATTATMIVICILASLFSLLRLRKVEPAMVF